MTVQPIVAMPLDVPAIYPLVLSQVTPQLLYTFEQVKEKVSSPVTFLDVGYGDPNFFLSFFKSFPVASYTFCRPSQEDSLKTPKDFPDFFHQIMIDKMALPFAAMFDLILVGCPPLLTPQTDIFLRHLIGCLKPGGRLYLVGLGECSLYEWFHACQQTDLPVSFPPLLTHRQPLWPEEPFGQLQEEWITLFCPTLDALLSFFERFQKNLFDDTPFARPLLQKAFDVFYHRNKGFLTLHLFYGCYTKPEEMREE